KCWTNAKTIQHTHTQTHTHTHEHTNTQTLKNQEHLPQNSSHSAVPHTHTLQQLQQLLFHTKPLCTFLSLTILLTLSLAHNHSLSHNTLPSFLDQIFSLLFKAPC